MGPGRGYLPQGGLKSYLWNLINKLLKKSQDPSSLHLRPGDLPKTTLWGARSLLLEERTSELRVLG